MSAIDTMVVGAGPYGLSIAAHLRAKGARFEIIGKPMEMWRASMPKGMLLKSEPFASNLWDPARAYTLEAFFKERGKPYSPIGVPTALSDFLDYTEWFHQKTRLDVQDRKLVHLRKSQGRFELQFQDGGRVSARTVVLATGLKPFCWMPPLLQALPPELLSHAADVSNPKDFAGREVIVVGAGQSATETAALLHEAGARVRLLVRGDAISWNGLPRRDPSLLERIKQPESGLSAGWRAYAYAEMPRLFSYLPADTRRRIVANGWGPSGSWWLKDRIVGKFPVLAGHRIERAREQEGRARLKVRGPDGLTTLSADHIVAATGYRTDIDRLAFLDRGLRGELAVGFGAPVLTRSFESTVAGLYFVGAMSAPTFGPVMRFMFGAKHAAPMLARTLTKGRSSRRAQPGLPPAGGRIQAAGAPAD